MISIATLALLLTTARDLTERGEPNAEYIRGQVNLIMDAGGDNPAEHDWLYDAMTSYIAHTTDTLAQILLTVERGRRRTPC